MLSEPSELPDFPTCKRREGVRSLDLWVTFWVKPKVTEKISLFSFKKKIVISLHRKEQINRNGQ